MPFGVCFEWNAPEQAALVGCHRQESISSKRDDLFDASKTGDDKGRIPRLVVLGFPEHFASPFVERNQARPVRAPNRNNNALSVNDSGTIIASPAGGALVRFAAQKSHAEIVFEACFPDRFSIGKIQAAELAGTRLHVSAVVIDDRSRSRPGPPFIPEYRRIRHVPDFLAAAGIQ